MTGTASLYLLPCTLFFINYYETPRRMIGDIRNACGMFENSAFLRACDRVVPTCSRCKVAGAQCTGFNPKGNAEIPRSVVHFLEHEIATLETEMAKEGLEYEISPKGQARTSPGHGEYAVVVPIMETESVVPAHPRYPRDVMKEAIMASDDVLSIISSTMPSITCLRDMLASVRMGLTPSYTNPPNLSDRADTTEIQSPIGPRPIEAQADLTILISLPADVIHSLVKRYVQRILPIYPFLYEPAIWEHMDRAIEKTPKPEQGSPDPSVGPDYDFLFVYLILAISSTLGSANSGHEARCMAFSGSLFAEGSQHLSRKASFPNHLAEIQSTLLILQYALINPKYANVWILSGVVMRSCLELGLHREVSDAAGLDPAAIDMRRRVFWTA
ncbi:Positive regulator of purine utilization [Lachnellula hyalina]|uniref:Positive regulator of purine utilization n=1 Tax=Lachnellula hyalina TaxID=1316788 RepID=A0A8H8U4Y7_9HELO|nr:Positive regulator of purine utilization [Lachnellula hyalina]TVY30688.1 Positive regulator of purine utilization [Lachnellula hyalina]